MEHPGFSGRAVQFRLAEGEEPSAAQVQPVSRSWDLDISASWLAGAVDFRGNTQSHDEPTKTPAVLWVSPEPSRDLETPVQLQPALSGRASHCKRRHSVQMNRTDPRMRGENEDEYECEGELNFVGFLA